MSETTNTNTNTTPATVVLHSRVHAATLDTKSGKVKLADNVDIRTVEPLLEDLVREIQVLQQQVKQLKDSQNDHTEKL